jgi:hypothetical protein
MTPARAALTLADGPTISGPNGGEDFAAARFFGLSGRAGTVAATPEHENTDGQYQVSQEGGARDRAAH